MHNVYTASYRVCGEKVQKDFSSEPMARLWLQMALLRCGSVESPMVTCETYSDIFNAPMTVLQEGVI